MATSFRDRFLTPPVARAIMSPLGILLAGAGTAVGIVAGLPVVAAAGIGAAAWAARVVLAVPRAKRPERIDPFSVGEPWRAYVQGALSARARFERTVTATREGPLRQRLAEIDERLQHGVDEMWRIASRGDDIDHALGTIDVRQAQVELAALRQEGIQDASARATSDALEAQLATAERLHSVSRDARNRLRLMDARMDELVARAVELSVGGSTDDLRGLGADVESLVTEMEALRQAVEETHRADGGTLPPPSALPDT
jgi:hypothetical protein